jgi:hypothetical protein
VPAQHLVEFKAFLDRSALGIIWDQRREMRQDRSNEQALIGIIFWALTTALKKFLKGQFGLVLEMIGLEAHRITRPMFRKPGLGQGPPTGGRVGVLISK